MTRNAAVERARVLRKFLLLHGVPEVSIELQIGRPTYGRDDWNGCQPVGVMSHHIASRPTPDNPTPGLWLVKHGRSDLPGPLCNGYGGMDLVYRIITTGYANHPGYGGPIHLSGAAGGFTIPEDNARPYVWGTEFEGGFNDATWDRTYTNKRTGRKMTFREFMGRVNAGLCEGIWHINGRNIKPGDTSLMGYHMEHKSWAPERKIDRLHYTTDSGRAEVQKYHQYDPKPNDQKPGELLPHVSLSNVQKAAMGKIHEPLPGVRRVESALNKRYDLQLPTRDGLWTPATTRAYKHHQKSIGSAPEYVDGIPGLKDLQVLARDRFKIVR